MRKRTVAKHNGEIGHAWYHQTGDLRTSNSNFYCEGPTIYSYGSHFPIATHITNDKGERAVLFTADSYSNSTEKHISLTRSAIPRDANVFLIPGLHNYIGWQGVNLTDTNKANIAKHYIENVAKEIIKAKRARKYTQMYLNNAQEELDAATEFVEFFGLDTEVPTLEELEGGELIATLEKKAREDRERDREFEKARKEREALFREKQKINDADKFANWQAGLGYAAPYSYCEDEEGSAYLRIKDDNVETSQGASVPMYQARRAFQFIKMCRMMGRPFEANGKQVRVGQYAFRSIDAQGNCHIGCHYITWKRLEELASKAGWLDDEASTEALEETVTA